MKNILIVAAIFTTMSAGAQTIRCQDSKDNYADIVPVQLTIFKVPTYLTRLHVLMPNDGSTATITYDFQYSNDSTTFYSLPAVSFSLPVDQHTAPEQSKVNVFNYIQSNSPYQFEWADN